MPAGAPEVEVDGEVRRAFGVRDPVAVVLRSSHPDGIFHPRFLRRLRDATAAIAALPGVEPAHLASLATEKGFRHRPGALDFHALLEPFPEAPEEIERLRDELRRIALYDGTLVSRDGRAAAILVGVPPAGDRSAFVGHLRRAAGPGAEVVGAPVVEALLGDHVLADLGVPGAWLDASGRSRLPLAPLAVAVMGLVFLAAFRRLAAALLPLAEAGCALAVVFGVMGWLGVPIYLTTTVLPVILTAVGVADEIHIFRRYRDLAVERPDLGPVERVRRALDEMTPPVVQTSLTTAAAFLSFALSPIGPVRAFGLFTAFGILVCMVFSLTVVPALLVVIPESRWLPRERPSARRGSVFRRLAVVGERRRLVGAAALATTLLALDGIRRVEVEDSWEGGLDPASHLAAATRQFEEDFLGSHLLQMQVRRQTRTLSGDVGAGDVGDFRLVLPAAVEVEAAELEGCWLRVERRAPPRRGRPQQWATWIERAETEDGRRVAYTPTEGGSLRFALRPQPGERVGYEISCQPLMTPALLDRLDAFEEFVEARDGVGGVLGPAKYLETVAFMIRPADPGARRLPDRPPEARALWGHYGRIRGEERLRLLVDPSFSRALVTAYLPSPSYVETERLLVEIRRYAGEHLEPHGIEVDLAGDVATSRALIDAVVATQVRSLLLSLLVIGAVAASFGGSLRRGVVCLVPPAFAVLLGFAAMGWLAVPLGVATSMFAGMSLGVGVDYAIHLSWRHRVTGSLRLALGATGPAIAIDALAVGGGFSLLTLSALPTNARLGALLVLAVAGCLAATLLIVPALIPASRTHPPGPPGRSPVHGRLPIRPNTSPAAPERC